jgi:hypothetical protein
MSQVTVNKTVQTVVVQETNNVVAVAAPGPQGPSGGATGSFIFAGADGSAIVQTIGLAGDEAVTRLDIYGGFVIRDSVDVGLSTTMDGSGYCELFVGNSSSGGTIVLGWAGALYLNNANNSGGVNFSAGDHPSNFFTIRFPSDPTQTNQVPFVSAFAPGQANIGWARITSSLLYTNSGGVLLGRSGAGAGVCNEITVGTNLLMVGSTLTTNSVLDGLTGVISTKVYVGNAGLNIKDTTGNFNMQVVLSTTLTANRTLTVNTGDANRVVTLTGNITLGGGGSFSVATGKAAAINNTLVFTGTDGSTINMGTGGTVAYTSNNLGVFAATTSAQLRGVVSDETGTGVLVFNQNPSLVDPVANKLFVADASSTGIASPVLIDAGFSEDGPIYSVLQNSSTHPDSSAVFLLANDITTDTLYSGMLYYTSNNAPGLGSFDLPSTVYLVANKVPLHIATTDSQSITLQTGAVYALVLNNGEITTGVWKGTPVGITWGGTGASTPQAGFNALSPLTTKGDLVVHNGTNNVRLPAGASNGFYLGTNNANANGVVWRQINLNELTGTVGNSQLRPFLRTIDAYDGAGTGGFITQTGTQTTAKRTISNGANITVTNGDGVSGNPTVAVTGVLPLARGAANADLSAAGTSGGFLRLGSGGTSVSVQPIDQVEALFLNANGTLTISEYTTVVRVSANANARVIQGIVGGRAGRVLRVYNASASNRIIMLGHQVTAATAANRLINAIPIYVPLAPEASVVLIYDAVASRWRASEMERSLLLDPRITATWYEDFMQGNHSGSVLPTQFWTQSGNGGSLAGRIEASTNGIIRVSTGTATNGYAAAAPNVGNIRNDYGFIFEARVRVPTLADGTDQFAALIGVGTPTGFGAVTNPTHTFFFVHDNNNANWRCGVNAGSAAALTNGTVAVVANTWHRLRIQYDYREDVTFGNGNVEFYVDDTLAATIAATNLSTNAGGVGFQISKLAGTLDRQFDVDRIAYTRIFDELR